MRSVAEDEGAFGVRNSIFLDAKMNRLDGCSSTYVKLGHVYLSMEFRMVNN
jgi:hypothetical protein